MPSRSLWDPLVVCEIEVGPLGQRSLCCGITANGIPCKNSVKIKDINQGHQKMTDLSRIPFGLAALQASLREIAKNFLCKRWHRDRQADRIGQRWYEAAVRNQAQAHSAAADSPRSPPAPAVPRQTRSAFRRGPSESDRAHRLVDQHSDHHGDHHSDHHSDREASPAHFWTGSGPAERVDRPTHPYVTAAMLRANNVPWRVTVAQPAILSLTPSTWAGGQDFILQKVTRSHEVDNIHCLFCLAEDENHVDERVVLRCVRCKGLAHLACTQEWLEKRETGHGTSCCICRTETAFHALYRGPRGPSPSPEESSVEAIADISSNTGTVTPSIDPPRAGVRLAQPAEPRRRHRGSAAPAAQEGVRRSARLAQVPAPLRRSTRFRESEM
ncbi:hypothetical protein N7476_000335 [Penicillium atrosanguineum]|uniref:RING-CH-type domain-containing protein n=1 Tax=Penicillium atrosanguineum TaxID=1132637 RepID=A0A9W9QBC8_9EURO|nr:hypothetical protein N7476_000335 [Penicillium atrosanguineum]